LRSNRAEGKRHDQHLYRAAVRQKAPSPHVIYAFGDGNIGITTAPMAGKLVADLVAGRPPPTIDIALLIVRTAISRITRNVPETDRRRALSGF
jgi:hypothetical protein